MGAAAQLRLLALEIARTVRVMDARNRLRFEGNGQELVSWLAASAVLGTPRGGSTETPAPPTGEVSSAA